MAKEKTAEDIVKQQAVEDKAPKAKPTTGREDWVYVTIPKEDMFGQEHPGIGHNQAYFAPGTTTLVHPDVAREVEEGLKRFVLSQHRQLSPRRDMKSIQDSGGRGNYVPDL